MVDPISLDDFAQGTNNVPVELRGNDRQIQRCTIPIDLFVGIRLGRSDIDVEVLKLGQSFQHFVGCYIGFFID